MSVSTHKPVTLNELNFFFFLRQIINILLTELSRPIGENLDLGRVYRPHCVRSVPTTSVKILPYRPPARLIRDSLYIELTVSFLIGRKRTVNNIYIYTIITIMYNNHVKDAQGHG